MRVRLSLVVLLVVFTTSAFAKDVYLSIGGSVGAFRTDARIVNPSFDKDILITARYLPVGNADNSSVTPKTITVAKRSQAVYDDVVQSLFGGGPPLGAVRLTSDDDFVATQRIYASSTTACSGSINPCTLGQFVPGLDVTTAKAKGVLLQIKSSASFRTNVGAVNPNATAAKVTWKLYDKNNALVATGAEITMPPFAVIGPTNVAGTFFFTPGSADLSDAWVSYTSDLPIFAYASVVDNGSTDPTFVPASEDTGVAPPAPQAKIINIDAFSFGFAGGPAVAINAGDTVKLVLTSSATGHGFQLFSPSGIPLYTVPRFLSDVPIEHTLVLSQPGTYAYVCSFSTCGDGHTSMTGDFVVGPAAAPNSK
jgi:plastocyanin